jgi:hypothetical protein
MRQPIANNGFENDVHAQLKQPLGQEKRICVLPEGRQQF